MDRFPPSNPNPNLNCNLNSELHPDPSNGDLLSTISLLKDQISVAETTLRSVSVFLSSKEQPFPDLNFCRCPYDPRHQMPPENLFRHSLRCSSYPGESAALLELASPERLGYTNSFKSEAELQKESRFVRPFSDSNDSDLCFSLDGDIGSNFFYKDCPGVVTFPEPDPSSRTFTLPGFMSVECGNFTCGDETGTRVLKTEGIWILPSELWSLRCEVEAWKDYPVSYSYNVVRVASCLLVAEERSLQKWVVEECSLQKWVISSSPSYGVLIDVAMTDHIFLLLKLCLRTIWREALSALKLLFARDGFLDPRPLSFKCPRLIGSLTWLASQLSILYGETNSKFFAIGMLKESLLHVGSRLLLFRIDENTSKAAPLRSIDADAGAQVSESKHSGDVDFTKSSENSIRGQVFISQVAAAIAALHERSLLEERINGLRFSQPLPRTHRLNEHSYASMKADEERGKRPNYRPILEHDGLFWQRSHNQDLGRTKTKEELLAEERDYKRRRMSYRGKKVKRTPTQVLRDIIEVHMEDIKLASGIGCTVIRPADSEVLGFESSYQSGMISHIREAKSSRNEPSETSRAYSHSYGKPVHTEHIVASRTKADVSSKDRSSITCDLNMPKKLRHELHETSEHRKRSVNKDKREKNYGSKSPQNYRSYRQSSDRYAQQDQGEVEATRHNYDKNSSVTDYWSRKHSGRSSLTSNSGNDLTEREYEHMIESRSRRIDRSYQTRRSESVTQDAFEDRYDPSGSYSEDA